MLKSDPFYLVLNSDETTSDDSVINSAGHFTNELNSSVQLDATYKWTVGVASLVTSHVKSKADSAAAGGSGACD